MHPRPVFTVSPAEEFSRRSLLFSTLGRALGVSFATTANPAEGRILFGPADSTTTEAEVPTLVLADPHGVAPARTCRVEFSRSHELPLLLRGALLTEKQIRSAASRPAMDDEHVLASCAGSIVWSRKRHGVTFIDHSTVSPAELPEQAILKDLFCDGNALSLLPLVHFVRSVLGDRGYDPPPLRATVVIDDLNLRAFSYGFVHIPTIVRMAEQYNFHVVLATIPLDMWWISRRVGSFAIAHESRLSLAIHGNDHLREELNQQIPPELQLRRGAQALKRTERFEQRYGVPVSRIVIPPHGMCSRSMLSALRALAFEAVCVSRPAAWVPHREGAAVVDGNRLQRWFPADYVDGMPILHRQQDAKDFLLNALLGQPLIAYFHHDDFADGYDWLCDLAGIVNNLGDVRWESLQEIARGNFEIRREDELLRIRPFSRAVDVRIPSGVRNAVLEIPVAGRPFPDSVAVSPGGEELFRSVEDQAVAGPIPVDGGTAVSFVLRDRLPPDRTEFPSPPFSPRPVVRRLLTETRDRLSPAVRRLRR